MNLDERLKIATQNYAGGYTCSQAVISAFLDEMDLDREAALRLMEGYGGGLGGTQEVCGALSAAAGAFPATDSQAQSPTVGRSTSA